MSFTDLMTDNIELLKTNGSKFPGLKAVVQGSKIYTDAENKVVIEPGDLIRRRLSTGAEETYRVVDPGFHEAFEDIPANYEMTVLRLDPSEAARTIASLGGEDEISEDRRVRLFAQWEEHGVDFIKYDLQNGGYRIVGGPPSTRKLAREWVRMKEAEQKEAAERVASHTIHLSGPNSRVNIHSTDQSTNTVVGGSVFEEINKVLDAGVQNEIERSLLKAQLNGMEAASDKKSFAASYQAFIGLAADHLTILTPFLPALTNLLAAFSTTNPS
jgi:hypothetical protein